MSEKSLFKVSHEEVKRHALECLALIESFFSVKEKEKNLAPDLAYLYRASVLLRVIEHILIEEPDYAALLGNKSEDELIKTWKEIGEKGLEVISKGPEWFVNFLEFLSQTFLAFYNDDLNGPDLNGGWKM